ncbi:MAG: hypothetical protein Q9209_004007 [Squamulea sp. 1 TL-2023]
MFFRISVLTSFAVLPYLASLVISIPLEPRPVVPSNLWTNENLSSPILVHSLPSLNDWEHFAYPIPRTKQFLKGRIFTSHPLRPSAIHFALDGGLSQTQQQVSTFGPTARLWWNDNPYSYKVPGCFVEMRSKVTADGRPTMTWKMMRDMFLALEQILEKDQRFFEVSFVLTDESQVSWGHGQLIEREPPLRPVDGE